LKTISSADNPRFRGWLRAGTASRAARAGGTTVAEGIHLAQAAITAGAPIVEVLLRRGTRADEVGATLEAIPESIPRFELAAALYDRISPVEHGAGLMLVVQVPDAPAPECVGEDLVYLDGIQDPGNVGAILRTAAAAGVRRVLASPGTAALWAPRVLRAAMGAHFRLRLHEGVEAASLEGVLKGDWVAAVAHGAPSIWRADFGGAVGWVFGSEGNGPSPQALAACKKSVTIPASDAVESLNVAAAAAICLFERVRRGAAPGAG
jgi:RNA methyltransferase, TrmH family